MATATQQKADQKRLKALSHPLRIRLFVILTERTASPAEMTRELGLPRKDLVNVNYHTKKLVELDCAELVGVREGDGKPPEKLYKATERALVETGEWEELLEANPGLAEHLLGKFMQVQLDDYTLALKARTVGEDENFHMSRTRRMVDREGLLEMLEFLEQARAGMDLIEQRSAERRRTDGTDAFPISSSFALFTVPASGKPSA